MLQSHPHTPAQGQIHRLEFVDELLDHVVAGDIATQVGAQAIPSAMSSLLIGGSLGSEISEKA